MRVIQIRQQVSQWGSAKKQEQEIDKLNHKVMQSFRLLLDLAGFEIVGRVTLRHKKSGRIFK